MALNNQPPYWEICKLSPFNDHFRVMYQDFSEIIQVGIIPFKTGIFEWDPEVNWEVKEDDTIQRFLDSIPWRTSFIGDTQEHRKQILEFHIANSSLTTDYLRVYWQGEDGEWESESWHFSRWDGFFEIIPPYTKSSREIKRWDDKLTPLSEIIHWLLSDISGVTNTRDFCFWIDFGNR